MMRRMPEPQCVTLDPSIVEGGPRRRLYTEDTLGAIPWIPVTPLRGSPVACRRAGAPTGGLGLAGSRPGRRGGRLATLSDDQRRWYARAWLAALGNPASAIDAPPLQVA